VCGNNYSGCVIALGCCCCFTPLVSVCCISYLGCRLAYWLRLSDWLWLSDVREVAVVGRLALACSIVLVSRLAYWLVDSSIPKRLLRLWNSPPPTPIKDIADSSSGGGGAAAANIASLGYFQFLFPEFPVEGRFIVGVHTLTVNNMKCDVVFEFEIRFLDSEF
jgi:hypothetical protein